MLLAIDIGNTHTVLGLFRDKRLQADWRISSDANRTEDEIGAVFTYLLREKGFEANQVEGVCISSVVPDLTDIYRLLSQRYIDKEPIIIDVDLNMDMKVAYHNPYAVGADRLCNAVAGIEKYGTPLAIIDFGTATTIDCINRRGDYLGGIIAPGITTAINTLHKRAAKLPRVALRFPKNIIGRTTEESMQSGILNGSVYMLKGFVEAIKNELGSDCKVIATGGMAGIITEQSAFIDDFDFNLSLEGIASIYYKNHR